MKKHLNTLFVTTQGAYLSKEGETVTVNIEKEVRLRVPIHTIGGIVCFGQVSCSPYLMGFCAKNNVGISFLTEYGRFLARVQGPVSGNVLLRREQYRKADDQSVSLEVSKAVLTGKIVNCRSVLQRVIRDHGEKIEVDKVELAVKRLNSCLNSIKTEQSLETVRGFEGDAARIYFGVFDNLITAQKESFFFQERSRRPPLDNVNCLLSFLYTVVMHDVRSALETVGLDPAVGFLHRDRPGRPGLQTTVVDASATIETLSRKIEWRPSRAPGSMGAYFNSNPAACFMPYKASRASMTLSPLTSEASSTTLGAEPTRTFSADSVSESVTSPSLSISPVAGVKRASTGSKSLSNKTVLRLGMAKLI